MIKCQILCFCLCFLLSKTLAQTNPNQPNILLIIADDLGVDAMNGYMNSPLLPTTPTLDSLRNVGLTFKNAWAAPKCSPTRAAIMTGKYGSNNCLLDTPGNLDTSHVSIFEALSAATNNAYDDAVFGKWHISNPLDPNHPSQLGVDHYEGFISGNLSNYYAWDKTTNGSAAVPISEYATAHLTNSAMNWINNRSKPWFLWFAHAAPHSPFHVPPAGTYSQAPTNNNKQKVMAMIENMDYEINRLLSGIPQAVKNNTVIIFIGDNGSPAGVNQVFPSTSAKGTVYQGGARVPLVTSGQGITRANQIDNENVHAVDIYATVLDIAGANLAGGIYNSRSFYPSFTNSTSLRKYNYTEIGTFQHLDFAITDGQYKLIQFPDGTQEFYDILIDSLEANNLINGLTINQEEIKLAMENESLRIQNNWSCNDGILNGQEQSIDCGSIYCFDCPPTGQLPCNQDQLVTCGNIALDTNIIANNTVISSHIISAQNARLTANNCIELQAGFEFNGGDLEVSLEACQITGIDDANCPNSNLTSQTNIGCCATPNVNSVYTETISNGQRVITTNNFPNHDYCFNNQNVPSPINSSHTVNQVPTQVGYTTSILTKTNNPKYFFGVALNGVKFAPAPATPFIFTNTNTGEYNWEWVYEPINTQGAANGLVKLDCASAHTGPQGYHYHGNMFQYAEEIYGTGSSTTNTPPPNPIHIGWAADGYPILYRFGPDENGNLALLQPSYQLKYGNRQGDGVSAPCGSYNGRYTNDYTYVSCSGDLDECNGVSRSITLTTLQGVETFDYFYVITDEFPQISRCFVGIPDPSFD